jgi:hypothetical protein
VAIQDFQHGEAEENNGARILQGVCKDCGNGTLNNDLNPAFEWITYDVDEGEAIICMRCGSHHLDLV